MQFPCQVCSNFGVHTLFLAVCLFIVVEYMVVITTLLSGPRSPISGNYSSFNLYVALACANANIVV